MGINPKRFFYIIIFLIFFLILYLKIIPEFKQGYEAGDAAFFDGYPNLQDFLEHRQRDGEGYADYWDERYSFWYEQGFEEGYKKATRN